MITLADLIHAGGDGSGCHGPNCGRPSEDKPVHHMAYSKFKGPSVREYGFDYQSLAPKLRRERAAHPDKKHWIQFSLGSSWHDPQIQFRIVSGDKPPDGVKAVETGFDLKHAWKHMQDAQAVAWSLSRKNYS